MDDEIADLSNNSTSGDEIEDENEDELESEDDAESSDELGSFQPKRMKKSTSNEGSFKTKVLSVLRKSCKVVGEFAVSGKLETTPLIVISFKDRNDEFIKFPLHEREVNKIIESFEQSPYGKGCETVVDTTVRNSWQLSPDGFEILNPDWDTFMKTVLVTRIKKEMSLDCSFVPSLHKLLLYMPGSFFKPHRDSEKSDGMFATLVIQLPSQYKGGQLVVRHDGRTKNIDFSSSDSANNAFSTFFSAFYCDVEHEILPVTEGYRLCLIYNLIAYRYDTIPTAPRNHALEMELIGLLKTWMTPQKLVYALTHKYSLSNICFDSLKTTDKSVARILKGIANECDLNIYLALFEKVCNGDSTDDYGYRYGCDGDCDFDSDDGDCEVSYQLNQMISLVGNEKIVSTLDVNFSKEVIPSNCFDNREPDDKSCEHTGNEGVQVNKTYRCAAITFWPKKFSLQILLNGSASDDFFNSLFIKEAEKYFENIDIEKDNKESKTMILEWAKVVVTKKRSTYDPFPLINAVIKFNNIELIQDLLRHIVPFKANTFPLVIPECEKYGWESVSAAIMEMFNKLGIKTAIVNLNLLFGNGNLTEEKKKVFVAALQVIFDKKDQRHSYLVENLENNILQPLINAAASFDDLELMKTLFHRIVPLNLETIPLLTAQCEKYGWDPFAPAIVDKFGKISKKDAVIILTSLIQSGNVNEDRKKLCVSLFNIILDKKDQLISNSYQSYSLQRVMSLEEKIKKQTEEADILQPFVNAVVTFEDLELLKKLFHRIVPLHSKTVHLLVAQCKVYGWNPFSAAIIEQFGKLSKEDAIATLNSLIQIGNMVEDKKKFCHSLLQIILDKNDTPSLTSNNFRPMSNEHLLTQEKDKQDNLLSVCHLAEKIDFNLFVFAKTQPFKDFVPVLLRLVPKDSKFLSKLWMAIAIHFQAVMAKESIKSIDMSWRRNISNVTVCCKDCSALNTFIQSNKESEAFRMGESRRKHLQHRINTMGKMSHRTDSAGKGQIGVLIVNKTEMTGYEALKSRDLSKSLLVRLQSIMPSTS